MEYTVVTMFDPSRRAVLLILKNKTEFQGLWNGVGGKVEPNETPLQCALHEVEEETGYRPDRLWWTGTLKLPHDCGTGRNEICTLHFFAGKVEANQVTTTTDEQVSWFNVDAVLEDPNFMRRLAGDGNLPYFIRQGLRAMEDPKNAYCVQQQNPNLA